MKPVLKALVAIALGLVIVFAILAAVGVWLVRRPWPQVDGTLAVAGLEAPVDVIRDEWGVPHIYAQNEHDLFFAQGYVHAQDRLWQMEFNRRIGNGTLSAALGESTLDADRFLRRSAERDWVLADAEVRVILDAYADGVNAYIETHRDRLPLEFTILGVDPAPWTPVDILARGKVMSLNLGANYEIELLRARIIAELGEGAARQLFHPHREDFISLWQAVTYHPMPFSREIVEADAASTLILVPQ